MERTGVARSSRARIAGVVAAAVVLSLGPALPGWAGTAPAPTPTPSPAPTPGPPPAPAAAPVPSPPTASERIAAFALRVQREMRASRYAPRNIPASTRTTGVFVTDCSGFVNFVVRDAAPVSYGALRRARHTARPTSGDYALGLRGRVPTWSRVLRVADVRAGDVIAWTRPAGSRAGHVMVVADVAHKVGARRWTLAIVDSTSVPHGRTDTRRRDRRNGPSSTNGRPSGVGRGTIGLVVDARGRPIAYTWSAGDRRLYRPSAITVSRALR